MNAIHASNQLGINGKSINALGSMRVSSHLGDKVDRFEKYDLQRMAGKLLYTPNKEMKDQHRTCWCHRGVASAADRVAIYRTTKGDNSRMHGVTTCKSVWACTVCSAKICAVRQSELSGAMTNWIGQGGYVWLMTLTFPHEREQVLSEMLPAFQKAQAFFKNSRVYKRIFNKADRKGSVTSLEVTYGEHGWHPHKHDLVFASKGVFGHVTARDNGSLESSVIDELKLAWYVALLKAGLCGRHQVSDVLLHGLDVRGGEFAAEYIAKFGKDQKWGMSKEVTMHASKVSSDNKGAHPFQLLAWAAHGDEVAGMRFREYVEAFEGKRMLSWSRGLKKELTGQDEMSDEEAADKEMPEEVRVGHIDSEGLAVLQSRHLLGDFLRFVAARCSKPGDEQYMIDEYIAWAKEQPRVSRGTVKAKMWSRGFMFVDREAMNA